MRHRWSHLYLFSLIMAAQYSVAEASNGLILHYDFNEAERVVIDRSGNSRDGIIKGAEWVSGGMGGGAMHLSGPQDRIFTSDEGFPTGDAARSFSWWFALDSLRPSYSTDFMYYGRRDYNHFTALAIDWRNGRDCPAFSQWGGVYLSGRRIDQVGVWIHLAFVYEGNGGYNYYVNGERWHGMSELGGPIETELGGVFAIGSHSPSDVHSLDGYIDDVRVYNRALSDQEVVALFRMGADIAGQAVRGFTPQILTGTERTPSEMVTSTPHVASIDSGTTDDLTDPAANAGSVVQSATQILRVGFSNDPEGDQDVTVFLPDEHLHVMVQDVDLHKNRTNVLMRITISQRSGAGDIELARSSELSMDDQGVYRGHVSLEGFHPGVAQVDLVGIDRIYEMIVLMRSSWIKITN